MKAKLLSVLVPGLLLCASAGATPITWHFSESGFDGGAKVTGTFTGQDLNSDGQLDLDDGELSAFSMHFTGNDLVPAFSMNLDDLAGFVYELNLGPWLGDDDVGDQEGIGGFGDNYEPYAVGPGPFQLCDGTQDCAFVAAEAEDSESGWVYSYSMDAVHVTQVTSVPEPSGFSIMLLGLLGAAALGFKARRSTHE